MKQFFTFLLCISCSLAVTAFLSDDHFQNLQMCPANLLQNGYLEGGISPWFGGGQLSSDAYMGSNALATCTNFEPAYQTIGAQANTDYMLKVFAKKDATTTGLITLKFMDNNYVPISTEFLPITVNTYKEISKAMTSPANTAWVEIGLLKDSGTGCIYADDWCLTATGGSGGTCSGNLLLNSTFSDNGAHWGTQSGASISYINNADSYDGTSIQMDNLGARLYQNVSVQAGKSYNLKAYVRRTLESKGLLTIKFLDANYTPLSEVFGVAEGNLYALQNMSATAPAGAVFGEVAIYKEGVLGSVFADDFCFSENNTGGGNQPDLTVENLNLSLNASPQGSIVNFNFDLKNIGNAVANGNFSINSYFSTDQTLSADDVQNGSIPTGNIAAGQSILQTIGAFWVPPTLPDGDYFILLKADADEQIVESDELNNVTSSATTFAVGNGSSPACGFEKRTSEDYPDFNNFTPSSSETSSGFSHSVGSFMGGSAGDDFTFTTYSQSNSGDFVGAPTVLTKSFPSGSRAGITLSGNHIIYSADASLAEAYVRLETPSGSTIFDKIIGLAVPFNTHNISEEVFELPSGGFYIVGTFQQGPINEAVPFIVKLDASGNLLWQKNLPTYTDDFNASLRFGAHGQGGATYLYLFNNSTRTVLLVKVDADGNELWKGSSVGDLVSTRLKGLVESSDGSVLYFGFYANPIGTVRRINTADGSILSETNVGDIGLGSATAFPSVAMSRGLIATDDGGVVGGFDRSFLGGGTGEHKFIVYRLTSTGAEEWSLPLNADYYADAQLQTADGGFYFIGENRAGGTVSLKVTADGQLTPACGTPSSQFVEGEAVEIVQPAPEVLAFPNPASRYINLDLSDFEGKTVDLTMVDAFGRVVLQRNNLNETTEVLELDGVESGQYFLQIRGEEFRPIVQRIVMEKGL